jgi:23S rRNA (adenine2503-C2)-methyltransferase
MGMGEPLDNLGHLCVALEHILGETGLQMSQRKVTVSTVGLAPALAELGRRSPAALAVSLNAPDDGLRSRLMPVNRRHPLAALHAALAAYPLKPTRRITLEYVLLGGVNDRPEQARELAKWVHGLRCKVNLIAFNPHEGSPFRRPAEADVERFREELASRHVTALVRASRGQDISAACGQLAGRAGG